jgi:dTDP-4-amino-4,6-dideoxygalactose transaminase
LEDCAQAHLATYDNLPVGSIGNAGTFSFYPGKNLGAYGDAGCIVTNDGELANWCRKFADHGGKNDHSIEGVNSRLDGLQAAILSAKLPHLVKWTKARNEVAQQYNRSLANLPQVTTPQIGPNRNHSYHLYVIHAEKRDELRAYLLTRGIETSCNYPRALPFYPAYEYLRHAPEDFPVAYQNQSRILSLPIYPELTNKQISYVVEVIREFYEL